MNKSYEQAKKLIEEARLSGDDALTLDGFELTEIPESLGELTHLRSLHLGHNKLKSFPEILGQLTNLRSLTLYDNHLTVLSDSLGKLTRLVSLSISYENLERLPESLCELMCLESLFLFKVNLTVLPESLGRLTKLQSLHLGSNKLTALPESLGQLAQLTSLNVDGNGLTDIPNSLGRLAQLRDLSLRSNKLIRLPDSWERLEQLRWLYLGDNNLTELPESLGGVKQLETLDVEKNKLTALPDSLAQLADLNDISLGGNPLNPELGAAYSEGFTALMVYLRASAEAKVVLNEAKLILIGEGGVGKSSLLGALRGDEWVEGRPTTHGIEIKLVEVTDPDTGTKLVLNGWDFGGQRAYRPTHQLFFSAPAVYLIVWKPREGLTQGFVKEWIRLVRHRAPDAKILVVATHCGDAENQPDINRQELWDLFGKDTVVDFFQVDSKPDSRTGHRRGIHELKDAIARVTVNLPDVGRRVPKSWQDALNALKETKAAYLPVDQVLSICSKHKVYRENAPVFVEVYHKLGHLIHYEHDVILQDIVILRPDWLATAISFVLDDRQTREDHGLVGFTRLGVLWNNPARNEEFRYPPKLHPVFLRLMERFDISYRVAGLQGRDELVGTSLVGQLVPDIRPDTSSVWPTPREEGVEELVQICRVVEIKGGQSATAEGLFFQLIVRLHKFSLGRKKHSDSVHWQRGLVLDGDYNGRAMLEHVGNDVRITVRAAYPERFLAVLTNEVKWLVDNFWAGLRCDVMVPCVEPCGRGAPGTGLFEVGRLIESRKRKKFEFPCPVCNEWQNIDQLLRNATSARERTLEEMLASLSDVRDELNAVRVLLISHHVEALGRLDSHTQQILSKVDVTFNGLIQAMTDEAREGPRLFSLVPVDRSFLNFKEWTSEKFRLTLWCEHSRLPLPQLDGADSRAGVYEFEFTRAWIRRSAPLLKAVIRTLSLVLPVASSATKLILDDSSFKRIEEELEFGKECIEAAEGIRKEAIEGMTEDEEEGLVHDEEMTEHEGADLVRDKAIKGQGAVLRQVHALLREKDPGYGGLVRVRNKRNEFLWVHRRFANEY